jgi:hypothetical protein
MPFCPNCRTEYVGDATRCADCEAELVSWLPQEQAVFDPAASKPAELCQVADPVQADLIEAQLRAVGIPVVRRPRGLSLFVPSSRLGDAQHILAGQPTVQRAEAVGLSELHRIRLVCDACEKVTTVDVLTEEMPEACSCGHRFDLAPVKPVLDKYREIMRAMADADYDIEIEQPREGE